MFSTTAQIELWPCSEFLPRLLCLWLHPPILISWVSQKRNFLQKPMPKPQPGILEYLSLSDSYPLTSLEWENLPVASYF